MNRRLVILAMLFSLTACTGQQMKQAAGYTAGTAMVTAATAMLFYGALDGEDDCDATCERDKKLRAAWSEAAEDRRAAERAAELEAAFDGYVTAEPDTGTEQRSVVFLPDDPAVPQQSVDRLDAVLPEKAPEDQ